MKKSIVLLTAVYFFNAAHAQSWLIDGNAGTNPALHYVGTKDDQPLVFRINSKLSGKIDSIAGLTLYGFGAGRLNNNSGTNNTAIGFKSMYSNIDGFQSTAVGAYSLYSETGGNGFTGYNTAIGTYSLYSNNGGRANTAVGSQSLYQNITGGNNTAIGTSSLRSNNGSDNTATGTSSLSSNSNGNFNTATGSGSLSYNSSGIHNMANGYRALFSNTGNYNTAAGSQALYNNSSGVYNTANGYSALYNNTTSAYNTATGSFSLYANGNGFSNTANGYNSLGQNSSGSYNTGMGYYALSNNSTSWYNTAVGGFALYSTTNSQYNTAIGYNAGGNYNLGWNNVFVGANCNANAGGLFNCVAIGNAVTNTASSQARIGNSSTTSIGGYSNWSNISDGRIKKNIQDNVPGLSFINKLKPVTYNLNLDAADKIIQRIASKDKDGKVILYPSEAETDARKQKEQIVYSGFIAQDVEKAAKEINYDFSGVDAAKNEKDLYGLRYAEFVVPLVKAVQELSKQNEELQKTISAQQSLNEELLKRIQRLESTFITKK